MRDIPRIRSALQQIDSAKLEELVAAVWSQMGWSTRVSQQGRDQGIDIVATKSDLIEQKAIIQAKRYSDSNKVGRPDIQQYSSLKTEYPDVDSIIVVTSSSFTSEAKQLAEQLGVKIVNGSELAEACVQNISEENLSKYIEYTGSGKDIVESSGQVNSDRIKINQLTSSEEDLADFYSGYLRRLSEAVQHGNHERTFFIKIDREHNETSEYTVRGTTHQIQFPAESPKLLGQLQKTAKKYGWTVVNSETYGSGAGGVEMVVPPEEANMFFISLDTTLPESPIPRRQARIIKLMLERIYDQDLSGSEITDLVHRAHNDPAIESHTRVIR
ncbi:restriction endonuclease [Halorubrum sp. CGM4_25_10-8A]|uniref:restriction endonuclease n=1 Tax=Halorubrum sp. CGM4_25_10-8A TaxID=2518116 RepID=UPI00130E89A0|nr:restriction endonuclease [Halorubrum sp. CGM4_25_10-8A]